MLNPDIINGLFEFFGAFVSCFNVRSLLRDKKVSGFNPWTTVFFTSWGLWNIYFYAHLEQWWSWLGGIAIVSVNAVWLCLVVYYMVIKGDRE